MAVARHPVARIAPPAPAIISASRARVGERYGQRGDYRLVSLSPDAAKLLRRRRVRTIKDVLDLKAWPYGRLRIAITRWSFVEVLIEPV